MWSTWLTVAATGTVFRLNLQAGEAKLQSWAGKDWLRVYADIWTEANTTAQVEVAWLDLSQLHQLLAFEPEGHYCCKRGNCTEGILNLPMKLPEDQYLSRMFEARTTIDFEVPPRARSLLFGGCNSSNPLVQVRLELNSTATYLSGQHHPLLVVSFTQFHAIMTCFYASLLMLWIGRVLRYRETAMALQRWAVPVVVVCCLGEQLCSFADWWEYELGGHKPILLVLSAVLGSARVSLAYVVILTLGRGYGVLRSGLRSSLVHTCLLGPALFLSHLLHSAVRYFSLRGIAPPLILRLSAFPIIILHACFYFLVFSSLKSVRRSLTNLPLEIFSRMCRILALAAALSVLWSVCELYGIASWRLDALWEVVFALGAMWLLWLWRPEARSHILAFTEQPSYEEVKAEDHGVELVPSKG